MSSLVLVGVGGAGLLLLAVVRPAPACALLAFALPVAAGLGRGTIVPVLRVNEVLLVAVTLGVLLGFLLRGGPQAVNGLDLVVVAFCAGSVLIPWAVIVLTSASADQQDWMTVLAPVQYLFVYLLYSRVRFPLASLRLLLNLMMLASIPVALVAIAQLLNVGGVRSLAAAYYPTQALPAWDTVYRPASLLGFYSAVGAFGLLNFLVAFALTATRHPGFSQPWLAVVMAINLIGLLASQTYAPLIALPAGVVAVTLVARRVPWRALAGAPPALAACAILLWPVIGGRVQEQLAGSQGYGLRLPESLATRVEYWQGFFVPALLKHGLWLGTGTLIPSEVPRPLVAFVDNGYLWQVFRAGLPGLALLVLLLGALAGVGWRSRSSSDPSHRAVGAVALGAVVSVVLVDTTSEYLTFTAVSQEFWMIAGLLSGIALASWAPARFVETSPGRPAWWERLGAGLEGRLGYPAFSPAAARSLVLAARRLIPEQRLVRSSVAVLIGFGLARLLGFGFQVASGRLLAPADYGRLTYALAVAAVSSVLLSTAPLGLSRFLARHTDSPGEQDRYYRSWLALIGLMLGSGAVATVLAAPAIGLGGWMLAGLLFNLLGVAALESYREVQRGLGRYTLQSAFYVLANALQLAAVLTLGGLGQASPPLFLAAYGLSGVVALVCFLPISRGGPRFKASALSWSEVRWVFRFLRPVLVQSIFWNLWFSGDLILIAHLGTATATGTYGAAKAIASGLAIIPTAVSFVFTPRVACLGVGEVRHHLISVLAFTGAIMLPMAAVVVALAGPATVAIYGARYHDAAIPLAVLTAGMAAYGLKTVLGGLWLGLGHPIIETISSGAGVVATLTAGVMLIPSHGAVGGATAFLAGAIVQLLVDGGVAIWAFGGRRPRIAHLGEPAATSDGQDMAADRGSAPLHRPDAPAAVLFMAEDIDPARDDDYTRLVTKLAAAVAVRRPVAWRLTRAGRSLVMPAGVRRPAPAAVIYASRGSVNAAVLVRTRVLKLLCRRAPVMLLTLRFSPSPAGWLLRLGAPDLLLVTSEHDRDDARRAGLNAAEVVAGDRLVQLLDDVAVASAPGLPIRARLEALQAKARRLCVALREWPRRRIWGGRLAYQVRRPAAVAVAPAVDAIPLPALANPVTDVVGVLQGQPARALWAAAGLAGLRVQTAEETLTGRLVDRALMERWPLLQVSVESLEALGESSCPALAAYVHQGGTLYLDGLRPDRQASLARLGRRLGVATPSVANVTFMGSVSFPLEQVAFARELAGARLKTWAGRTALAARGAWEVLAHGWAGQARLPVVARRQIGRGGLVLSTAGAEIDGRLADAFLAGSATAMPAILSVLLLRSLYGSSAWHPPAALANFTIDDPALRRGMLGLRWDLLLSQARDHGFHTTVATVPRELRLADPAVIGLLHRYPAQLSACYHGCDHDGYEFYSPNARRTRYASRPLAAQQRALDRAIEHGRRLALACGHQLDRVMVFPHGIGPPEVFPDLHGLGFIATCNYLDKYPPGAGVPDDPCLGLRPADVAWAGFPLLWRRGIEDEGYLLDLVLGRPALTFAHRRGLGFDFDPFVERAHAINRATEGAATWCSLDEIARHAYLQRRRDDGGWEVLMTTNEACLHNPDREPRTIGIHRPHTPSGAFLEVNGESPACETEVTIPAGGTAVARLVAAGTVPALAGRYRCSIFTKTPTRSQPHGDD